MRWLGSPFLRRKGWRRLILWRRFSGQSLSLKLILAVSVVVCSIVFIGTLAMMEISRREIAETSVSRALYETQLLKSRLVDTMLAEDPRHEGLSGLLTGEHAPFDARLINIFDQEGKITFSSDAAQVGSRIEIQAVGRERVTPDDARIYFSDTGKKKELRIVHPLKASRQCASCHKASPGSVIGGIELHVPLTPVYKRFMANRVALISSALAIILLCAFMIRWLVRGIVKRPIQKLQGVMEKARGGVFPLRARIHEDPDLKHLARSFNTMVKGIEKAHQSLEAQHRKELMQANRLASLGQFISTISHEIKNPLAAISATLHALQDEFRSREGREIFRELNGQLERIERTVNNLLRFARHTPPQFESCELIQSIQRALQLAHYLMKQANIQVRVFQGAPKPRIYGDGGQLEQIFLNLILNATDALAETALAQKVITVQISEDQSSAEESGIRVTVSDTGPGIPEALREKVFEPFFSTKKNGTGLGLSVVKGLVKAHRGTISIKSAPDGGALIELFFPKTQVASLEDYALPVAATV